MRRRDFLASGAALTAVAALPRGASADTPFAPKPDAWRKFEVVTRVEIVKPSGKAQAWLPLPAVSEPDWTQPLGNEWKTNAKTAVLERDPVIRRADAAPAMGGRRAGPDGRGR